MNYLNLCVSACLAHSDLRQIDQELGASDRHSPIIFIKHALVSVANLADLIAANSMIYKEFPEISALYKPLEKKYEFCKYIRNKFVGHTNKTLIEKAVEWRPELRSAIFDDKDATLSFINISVLETIINTYVDDAGNHRIFSGETDLIYPPDMDRFMTFVTEIVRGGIALAKSLSVAARSHLSPPASRAEALALAIAAGETEFKLIPKPR